MSILRNLALAGAIGAGAYHYAGPGPAVDGGSVGAGGNPSQGQSFVALPVSNQRPDAVYVAIAENCPREDARRAERLAQELERSGVQVVRTSQVAFTTTGDDPGAQGRIAAVMGGRLPIVFVRGKAASNPSAQQVIAEFKNTDS